MQIEIMDYHLILNGSLPEILWEDQVSIKDQFPIPKCVIASSKEVCAERPSSIANWMPYC